MAQPLRKTDRVAIASDLLKFTQYCFARNNRHFELNHHHITISNMLMRVFRGEVRRLIINLPPRYTKTELAVVNFMAWALGVSPDCEFIHISYSSRLAANNTYNARALIKSEGFLEVFPDVKLMDDSKARNEWRTQQGGVVYATGSDGTITGYGAGKMRPGFGGAVIIDDPHKAGEAESSTQRQNVIEFYKSTVESRCNSEHTPIIVIMQRLHHNDLVGWLLDGGSGDQWTHLKLPAIDEQGNALWPFKHTIERLRIMEAANPYQFAGQYMQEPTPRDGGIIKSAWLETTRYQTLPAERIRTVQSWDTAYKAAQINDPSACTTWLQTPTRFYLVESFTMRGEYPAVKRAIESKYQQYMPDAVLIEDKASGQSLIQELKQTHIPVIAIKPEGDKETRLNAVSVEFEAGKVFLPEAAHWLIPYEAELFAFPKAKHDDQVDSTSQALRWMIDKVRGGNAYGVSIDDGGDDPYMPSGMVGRRRASFGSHSRLKDQALPELQSTNDKKELTGTVAEGLRHIENAGTGNYTKTRFIDDHEPIGEQLIAELQHLRLIIIDENERIQLVN